MRPGESILVVWKATTILPLCLLKHNGTLNFGYSSDEDEVHAACGIAQLHRWSSGAPGFRVSLRPVSLMLLRAAMFHLRFCAWCDCGLARFAS